MLRSDANLGIALRTRIRNAPDDLARPVPDGVRPRALLRLVTAVAFAAGLSAVLGVTTALTRHEHDLSHRTATSPPRLPSTPFPTVAPVSTPSPTTSSISAAGGPWILFGAGEESTEVDAAGWDGRRSGVLHVAPTSNSGGEGLASFDGRHVVDANGTVWSSDGRYEGSASGASAWGDDSRTLCGVKPAARPVAGSTADPAVAPVVFFTTVPGGASVDVGTFTPQGIDGDAHTLACGTGDGSTVANVFSQRGSDSVNQLVRIHHGVATVLVPPVDTSASSSCLRWPPRTARRWRIPRTRDASR